MVSGTTAEPCTLGDLIPEGVFVGTSLILCQRGRLLYGVRPPQAEGSRGILQLTGIGGGVEDEDESLTAAVLREAREEIGGSVHLVSCRETVVVRGPHHVERVMLEGDERPAAVVFRCYRTPPHQPWHEDNQGEACLVVFLAELGEGPAHGTPHEPQKRGNLSGPHSEHGSPWPAAELPALVWLKPLQVVETARQDVPLARLVESGAELVEGLPGSLPRTAWARLTDSQEALALALGDSALSFYEAFVGGPRP